MESKFQADVLSGKPLVHSRVCRTCSDCGTAPGSELISGCFLLDPFYRQLPEKKQLELIKIRKHQIS